MNLGAKEMCNAERRPNQSKGRDGLIVNVGSSGGCLFCFFTNAHKGQKGFRMKKTTMVYAAMFAVVMAAVMVCSCVVNADGLTEQERACFDAINAFRAKYKLPALELDDSLVAGSRSWSIRMRATKNFNHAGLTAKGVIGGENIAMGNTDGVTTFRQWERSSGHRALLLSRTATHAGVGADDNYWTFRVKTVKPPKEAAAVAAKETAATKTVVKETAPKAPQSVCTAPQAKQVVRTTSIRTVPARPLQTWSYSLQKRGYVPFQPARNTLRFFFR